MANDKISVEFYGPADHEAVSHEVFLTWEMALTFIQSSMRTGFDGFIRVFVPSSLAKNTQNNELREALGLRAEY
jgi:hypothetical protein